MRCSMYYCTSIDDIIILDLSFLQMSPLSSMSLVMQGEIFSTKTFALMFSYISRIFAKFTTSLKLFIIFLCKEQMQRTKVVALFCTVPERKVHWSIRIFVCSSDLNILEFPILMLLDSRQRLSNNLSDHFIDQILKMFIYLTLGRGKSRKRNKILQIYKNGQFQGTNLGPLQLCSS